MKTPDNQITIKCLEKILFQVMLIGPAVMWQVKQMIKAASDKRLSPETENSRNVK